MARQPYKYSNCAIFVKLFSSAVMLHEVPLLLISRYNWGMDVSVGHLNNRLALQLPRELPLGLVFVVGTVDKLRLSPMLPASSRKIEHYFDLVDDTYRLRCRLIVPSMVELDLTEGDRVRVGGHLRFDAQQATYYLLARDIEQINHEFESEELEPGALPDEGEVLALLADIRQRDKQVKLPPADLPRWVQEMAPPEVKEAESTAVSPPPKSEQDETAVDDDEPMDEELVSYLSEAIEEEEDVEITADVIAQFTPEHTAESSAAPAAAEEPTADAPETPGPLPPPPPVDEAMIDTPVKLDPEKAKQFAKTPDDGIDWLVVLLVVALLLVAAITAVILLSA